MKKSLIFAIVFSIGAAIAFFIGYDYWEFSTLRTQIAQAGVWAPLIYVVCYTVATALILPSTVLNLTGGALFGTLWGLIWTSLAAILSAVLTFWVTRKWVRDWVQHRLDRRWENLDSEVRAGGIFYLLAIRLLPIIPYGIVNYSAGISSVRFYDYLIGTSLGTIPGLLPFVMLGSSGVEMVSTGQVWHIFLPLSLIGLLIGATTWYKRHHRGG